MVLLKPRPLSSLPTDKLSTGCSVLDGLLCGGLPCGSLTELAGEAAASKSQISMQLLLTVQLPHQYGGLEGSAVYVYTEGEPAMRRLRQLARWLHLRYPAEALAGLPDPTANIFVEKSIASGAELLRRLQRLRGLLDQQRRAAAAAARRPPPGASSGHAGSSGCCRPVRLLVVDSVAHLFRDLGDSVGVSELSGRTETLFKISALLRRYADEYNLAVLLVNQVVDCVDDTGRGSSSSAVAAALAPAKNTGHTAGLRLVSLGREVVPALGLAWANCVNTRLFLSRCGTGGSATPALFHGAPSAAAQAAAAAGDGSAAAPALRKLQVVFSPHLPQGECYYVVEASGVRGLHPEELEQHDAAAAAAAQAAWEQQQRELQQCQQQEQQEQWRRQQQYSGQGWQEPLPVQQGWQGQQLQQQLEQGWQQPQEAHGRELQAPPPQGWRGPGAAQPRQHHQQLQVPQLQQGQPHGQPPQHQQQSRQQAPPAQQHSSWQHQQPVQGHAWQQAPPQQPHHAQHSWQQAPQQQPYQQPGQQHPMHQRQWRGSSEPRAPQQHRQQGAPGCTLPVGADPRHHAPLPPQQQPW